MNPLSDDFENLPVTDRGGLWFMNAPDVAFNGAVGCVVIAALCGVVLVLWAIFRRKRASEKLDLFIGTTTSLTIVLAVCAAVVFGLLYDFAKRVTPAQVQGIVTAVTEADGDKLATLEGHPYPYKVGDDFAVQPWTKVTMTCHQLDGMVLATAGCTLDVIEG